MTTLKAKARQQFVLEMDCCPEASDIEETPPVYMVSDDDSACPWARPAPDWSCPPPEARNVIQVDGTSQEVIEVDDNGHVCIHVCDELPLTDSSSEHRNELILTDSSSEHNAKLKRELWKIINSIQESNEYGIYVCESFRDPRRQCIDTYWSDVEQDAVGLHDVGGTIGRNVLPLTPRCKEMFSRLSHVLGNLSKRIDKVLEASGGPRESMRDAPAHGSSETIEFPHHKVHISSKNRVGREKRDKPTWNTILEYRN
jgi:hypothetical protein